MLLSSHSVGVCWRGSGEACSLKLSLQQAMLRGCLISEMKAGS